MKFDRKPIEAKTRKLSASFSMEAMQDIQNINDPEGDRIERMKKLKEIDPEGITDEDLKRQTPSIEEMMIEHLKKEVERDEAMDKLLIAQMVEEAKNNGDL